MDQYIGEIRMFAGTFAPMGWAFCDGGLLDISQNDVLFSLLGTTYGGDGQTNFALPDLRGRIPIHRSSTYPIGTKAGVETVTLTVNNLPAHTHTAAAQTEQGGQPSPEGAVWATSTVKQYATTAPSAAMSATAISAVGGSQPHENMMPFLAIHFIIALEGLYPSQS